MNLSRNVKVNTLIIVSIIVVITSAYLHLHQQVIGNELRTTQIHQTLMLFGLGSWLTKFGIMAPQTPQLNQIGPGFWNVRASFKLFKLIDIGTHMSLVQLRNGNFLVIDTVEMNDQLKKELDDLTNNGTKIEAVVGVHPFHTLAFPGFYKLYPDAKYYGTPRHLRNLKDVQWTGQLDDNKESLSRWEPEVELRIPAGAEYINPQPEKSNHFVSVFVHHRDSKTLHVDDTLMYAENPGIMFRLFGLKAGSTVFHPSIKDHGLYPTAEAPLQFRDWINQMLKDWDFDNLCTAHIGVKSGGAHAAVEELMKNSEKFFIDLSERNKKKIPPTVGKQGEWVSGNECG
ncbi:uncharacterized protein LOC119081980 [Bradysia coprophila]|uniref:uncharacterized protein LOC119081980 n=1 Tax=Bradysia coprophila TaxID=38358 RepID=UPI00187D8BE0|nr:uncharacterized protein LOC119081980 [Bradysia coprophila]